MTKQTASQTIGPFFHHILIPREYGQPDFPGATMVTPQTAGEHIRIQGRICDGDGQPVDPALIEIWQADANGIYPHPEDPRHAEVAAGFRGWGRIITDFDSGLWSFETIKPGPVRGRNNRVMAPHISLWLVSRGINIGLNTRMYFDDEDNSADPVLGLVEQENRRRTLIAQRTAPGVYRFDIRLQGEGETVFLDV